MRGVVSIQAADLAPFATQVARSSFPIEPPPLFERLAAVAQPGYVDERFPMHPARAVMEIKRRMPLNGLVTAAPGPAGLWVARTFPTDAPGTVIVPAVATPGIGVAVALAAARAGIPATAVETDPLDDTSRALLELAEQLDAPVTIGSVGRRSGPVAHLAARRRRGPRRSVDAVTDRKVAMVTGASSGIGRAIAVGLGRLGWRVALGARGAESLKETAAVVIEAGGEALPRALDVTDAASVDAFVETVEDAMGPIDVLVNNAGIAIPGHVLGDGARAAAPGGRHEPPGAAAVQPAGARAR